MANNHGTMKEQRPTSAVPVFGFTSPMDMAAGLGVNLPLLLLETFIQSEVIWV